MPGGHPFGRHYHKAEIVPSRWSGREMHAESILSYEMVVSSHYNMTATSLPVAWRSSNDVFASGKSAT